MAGMSTYTAQIAAYEAGAAILQHAVSGLSSEQLNARVAPGMWSIQEVMVHLLDSDLASTHRMRRIVAEELPLLIAYDEDAFIAKLPACQLDLAGADRIVPREVDRAHRGQLRTTICLLA